MAVQEKEVTKRIFKKHENGTKENIRCAWFQWEDNSHSPVNGRRDKHRCGCAFSEV
jgi:hypothetical protein